MAGLALCVALAGCETYRTSPRLAHYRPRIAGAGQTPSAAPARATRPLPRPPDLPATAVRSAVSTDAKDGGASRRLRCGDQLTISKLGIPQQEETKEVLDENGNVTLSYIGSVRLDGLTTSEAEDVIERAYVDGGFYKAIQIVVIAQAYQYFVRGEVRAPGRYPLTPGLTLLRAITAAGSYTEFANPRKITVRRGGKTLKFDAKFIEDPKAKREDPLIEPEDEIIVARGMM
jgi:polysaccharide export outer membrane protein